MNELDGNAMAGSLREIFAVDVTADDAPKQIVDLAVKRWGEITYLINNAGVAQAVRAIDMDAAEWRRVRK